MSLIQKAKDHLQMALAQLEIAGRKDHQPKTAHHDRTTYQHMLDVAAVAEASGAREEVVAAGIIHDNGKPTALDLSNGENMFKHEALGAEGAEQHGFPALTVELIKLHGHRMNAEQVKPAQAYKTVKEAADRAGVSVAEFVSYMALLNDWDCSAFSPEGREIGKKQMEVLVKKIEEGTPKEASHGQ